MLEFNFILYDKGKREKNVALVSVCMFIRWFLDILVLLTIPIGFTIGFIPNLIFICISFMYQFESDEDKLELAKFMLFNVGYKKHDFDAIYMRALEGKFINSWV